jgi:hypothetical protein
VLCRAYPTQPFQGGEARSCLRSGALSHRLLETFKIIPDGHGEGEQFFQRLVGIVEGDGDAAGLESDADGKIRKFLRQDLEGSLDEKLRLLETVLFQLRQNLGKLAAALALIKTVVALGQAAQVVNENLPIGQAVGADAVWARRRPTPRRNSTVARSMKGRGSASSCAMILLSLLYQTGLAGTVVLGDVSAHQRKIASS